MAPSRPEPDTCARFRTFTIGIKSFSSGPSNNQMEDAGTKRGVTSSSAVRVMYNQIEDE